jgi:hypothetical protein
VRPPAAALPTRAANPDPAAAPVTGRNSASVLPVRVPMAQLPDTQAAPPRAGVQPAPPAVPASRGEPDPDAVGSTLARFYGGVRKAEAEDAVQTSAVPAGSRIEEEQQ